MKHSIGVLVALLLVLPGSIRAQVPVDHIPHTLTLPESYPDSWVWVYVQPQADNFLLGSYAIVDIAATAKEFKGQVQGALFSSLIAPSAGREFYVAEGYLDKGSHGHRSDVLTVIDKAQLNPVTEIALPGAKRGFLEGNLLEMTRDGAFLLVYNFTPAASVSVIDVHKRRLIGEVPTPGCTSIYPSGMHSFSSLCENGTLVTLTLGEKGQVLHESRSAAFNDIDHDVLFVEPASLRDVTYFVSERGNVRPVQMKDGEAQIEAAWPLMTAEQVSDGWRTAAGRLVACDDQGHLFVRVYRETGYEAQMKDNTEVWVYDVAWHERIRRIPLKEGGSSIEVTPGSKPYLVVVEDSGPNAAALDIYDAQAGTFIRTIGGWLPGTQLSLLQARR